MLQVHPASIQDRDGAIHLLRASRPLLPFIERVFADSAYAGERGTDCRSRFNSERFDGRSLALRLVALGYENVYWCRGGREAWEVAGLPETQLDVQDW